MGVETLQKELAENRIHIYIYLVSDLVQGVSALDRYIVLILFSSICIEYNAHKQIAC